MNGTKLPNEDDAQAGAPTNQDATAAAKGRAVLDAQVTQIVGVVIRGILVSSPGVPGHEVLASVARVTGTLTAGALQGDLQALLTIRKSLKDAFGEGMQKAPLIQPANQQPAAPSRRHG